MYQEFSLRVKDTVLMGYHWSVDVPEKVVMIIHGIGEHGGRFHRLAREFNQNNMAALSMDLRGHGCSMGKRGHTAPRASILEDINELIQFTKQQYWEVPLILYGHSMGGNLVLDYRSRGEYSHSISAYVSSSPWLVLKRKIPKLMEKGVIFLGKRKPDLLISAGIKPQYLGNKNVLGEILNPHFTHNTISLLTAAENHTLGAALMKGEEPRNQKNGCHKPLLLMHGSQDPICSVEGSRSFARIAEERGENVKYVEWSGYFHELHNGNREKDGREVMGEIIKWVKQMD